MSVMRYAHQARCAAIDLRKLMDGERPLPHLEAPPIHEWKRQR